MSLHTPHLALAASIALGAMTAGLFYEHQQIARLSDSLAAVEVALSELVSDQITTASSTAANLAELSRREVVVGKSESQLLEEAVAKVTPAVVSIVESRVVPLLRVSYENPFGNDPFFRGFGLQVPVYQQVGTTTQNVSAGTGFIVRSSGYLVTNKHVVGDTNATYTALLASGSQKPAQVVWRSPTKDLAVLKIEGSGYPFIPLGSSTSLRLAQTVFAVGNSLGEYNNSVSVGVISGLHRSLTASDGAGRTETLDNVIQTDAAINPGNSGGPLVNLQGEAVGINVAMVRGSQNIGFSLPISDITAALAQLGI